MLRETLDLELSDKTGCAEEAVEKSATEGLCILLTHELRTPPSYSQRMLRAVRKTIAKSMRYTGGFGASIISSAFFGHLHHLSVDHVSMGVYPRGVGLYVS